MLVMNYITAKKTSAFLSELCGSSATLAVKIWKLILFNRKVRKVHRRARKENNEKLT